MLEWFPRWLEQEDGPEGVVLSGYAEQAPADGLIEQTVADGWETRWREYHRPVRVGAAVDRSAVVSAGQDRRGDRSRVGVRHRARIRRPAPRSSFCSGFAPQPLLDLGCGSGVLSIAALKLGFGPVAAFDLRSAGGVGGRRATRR